MAEGSESVAVDQAQVAGGRTISRTGGNTVPVERIFLRVMRIKLRRVRCVNAAGCAKCCQK